jgi:hypothetical protein
MAESSERALTPDEAPHAEACRAPIIALEEP